LQHYQVDLTNSTKPATLDLAYGAPARPRTQDPMSQVMIYWVTQPYFVVYN